MKKSLFVLVVLLFSLQTISYSQTPEQKKIDSLLSINNKYKEDAKTYNVRIDSLSKAIAENNKPYEPVFTGGSIAVYLNGLIVIFLLIYVARKSPKDKQFALGLPDGSVRAIIAILAIVFYILASVSLSLLSTRSTIPTDVTKTLGTLVVAISAFYFGSKTAEQGSKTATENLTTILNNTPPGATDNTANNVPLAIIQQAITANKTTWMGVYNCTNVIPGKKKTQDTQHDVDCIVFVVKEKFSPETGSPVKPIPPIIPYSSGGKQYNIPTDVLKQG
ncbi:MAG: hypothetical protein ABUM51_03785 [Bacteroidota bacterium]